MTLNSALKATLITSIASLITLVPNGKPIQTDVSGHKALIPVTLTQPLKADLSTQSYIIAKELPKPVQVPVTTPSVAMGTPNNGDKAFIYQHESGNRTTAVNQIGCRGLGQACPGSKLPCGDDYACQDAWFSNYAETRYNGWSNARKFWEEHHWW